MRYSFTGGADGAFPNGGLVDVKGTMYGMAEQGGTGWRQRRMWDDLRPKQVRRVSSRL
ncbi:MAG: hypothetical protein WBE83_14615 [Candidatus Cybelea sp.]